MGFWSFHLDTIFMSTFLGLIFFGFFGLVLMGAKKGVPGKVQNFAEFVFEFISGAVKKQFSWNFKNNWPACFCLMRLDSILELNGLASGRNDELLRS